MKRLIAIVVMVEWMLLLLAAMFFQKKSGTEECDEGSGMPCVNLELSRKFFETYKEPLVVPVVPAAFPVVEEKASIPLYTVNGALLDPALQEYAYNTLSSMGIEWYYPTFLCQMYQESGFNPSAVSPYGDYGLCQLKGKYHEYFADLAGIPGADLINDPLANIYVGAFLMAFYYDQCGDVNMAISTYYTGSFDKYNGDYVQQVRQWESTIKEVNHN